MKLLSTLLVCLPVHLAALASPASAQARAEPAADTRAGAGVQATLAALERQRVAAILRYDVPTLRHLLARDYYHIASSGRVRSKTELLAALERKSLRFLEYRIESTDIRFIAGSSTVLVTGTFHSLQAEPNARPVRARYSRIWVRQPDGWKLRLHQTTEIRPAQDSCRCD